MARPKRHPDSTLIDAAAAAIAERGATAWSLEDVASRTGMSAAALIKRFGSKRGLLLAVVRSWVASIPEPYGHAGRDPLAELEALVGELFAGLDNVVDPVGHLSLLLAEVTDPEIRPLVHEGWQRQERLIASLVTQARALGALGAAPEEAGSMIFALVQGNALRWSVQPEGSLPERQRRMLRTLIEGWNQNHGEA